MPSHTMYALNMERILSRLWHPSHEELEQDHVHRQRLAARDGVLVSWESLIWTADIIRNQTQKWPPHGNVRGTGWKSLPPLHKNDKAWVERDETKQLDSGQLEWAVSLSLQPVAGKLALLLLYFCLFNQRVWQSTNHHLELLLYRF